MEAPEFVTACTNVSAELGLIASDYLYEEVIRHSGEPAQFSALKVTGIRQRLQAWTSFQPNPEARLTAAMFGGAKPADAEWADVSGMADLHG